MYEIWYVQRDDWGVERYYKRKGFVKKLGTAIKICNKHGKFAYVKQYGTVKPVHIVGVTQ